MQDIPADINKIVQENWSELVGGEPEESQLTWDDALTDAIEATEGNIQHYTKIMNYLNENFIIQRKKI